MRTQKISQDKVFQGQGYLTLVGENLRKTYELSDFITIGRDLNSQIMLNDDTVSNRHARIEKREDGYYLRDLRSRNGTFINNTKVFEAKLQEQDRLRIGMSEMIFSTESNNTMPEVFTSSKNSIWNNQLRKLPALAASPYPILILGESGTGKEVLANMIHKFSPRSKKPFLSINCSALTETLAESELFGHIKGSFTGANEERKGAFLTARGGTLFLDEIGDMPLAIQPKFLRALENNEVKPVGSDKTESVDVRIVAATNKNLKQLVGEGKFREDLYFRLHILQLTPPRLAERIEDFDDLFHFFAKTPRVYFSPTAMAQLKSYAWPGNIRELKNVIARASALFAHRTITERELSELLNIDNKTSLVTPSPTAKNVKEFLHGYEKEAIIERLKFHNGNQRQAAYDLGLAKSTLNDRIKKYDINVREFKIKASV